MAVHLDHAGLSLGFGRGDDLDDLLVVLSVKRQELHRRDEHRTAQACVRVRAGLHERQSTVTIWQCLGRTREALLRPRRLGERSSRIEGDDFPADVDLAGPFPVPSDRLIREPGVMGHHLVRVVIEKLADDLLRDIEVDQGRAQRVPPLMRCEMDGLATFVTNVAFAEPALERTPIDARADRLATVRVGERAGEQDRGSVGEAGEDPALLLADQALELFVDRHERLAAHLVVVVAQVRSSVTVLDDAVEGKFQRIGHPQTAADQDARRQLVGRIVEALEVGGTLHLSHHVLRQRPWQLLGALWVVLRVEGCGSRERQVPAVVADCLEELVQEPDVAAMRGAACELGGKVGQVLLQHGPVDISQPLDAAAVRVRGSAQSE